MTSSRRNWVFLISFWAAAHCFPLPPRQVDVSLTLPNGVPATMSLDSEAYEENLSAFFARHPELEEKDRVTIYGVLVSQGLYPRASVTLTKDGKEHDVHVSASASTWLYKKWRRSGLAPRRLPNVPPTPLTSRLGRIRP